jgi:transposase InsO family protein
LEFFAALPLLFVTGAPQHSPRSGVAITTPLDTATASGLKLYFTPVRSPESNGIAEAFVKTFKRDYARPSILPDAETLIALLPAWFEELQ